MSHPSFSVGFSVYLSPIINQPLSEVSEASESGGLAGGCSCSTSPQQTGQKTQRTTFHTFVLCTLHINPSRGASPATSPPPLPPQSVLISRSVALTLFLRQMTLAAGFVPEGGERHQRTAICPMNPSGELHLHRRI